MSISRKHRILTERLCLRFPEESELPLIFMATKTPGFNDGMVWDKPETIDEMIPFQQDLPRRWETGEAYIFSLYLRDGDDFVGRIGVRSTEEEKCWNIGFFTLPEHQGQGYMSEALGAALEFGFRELGAERIESSAADWNKASRRVLEKGGMRFLRHEREGLKKKGKWVALDYVVIERVEWERR